MITRETAARIAYAHDEIKAAGELLETIAKAEKERQEPDFRDVFGRRCGLQLGVPSGQNSHRLMDVSYKLAAIIIRAHIDDKRREIEAFCEVARGEIDQRKAET